MTNRVKSARGQLVDFDIIKIKSEMGSTPKPTSVAVRERFVDQRVRRRSRALLNQALEQANTASVTVDEDVTDDTEVVEPVAVEPKRGPRSKPKLTGDVADNDN